MLFSELSEETQTKFEKFCFQKCQFDDECDLCSNPNESWARGSGDVWTYYCTSCALKAIASDEEMIAKYNIA